MMQDGQTATNPQTGEKVVLRGGQWVPMGDPAAPPAGPAFVPGIKQADPIEAERLDMARQDQARQNQLAPLDAEAKRLDVDLKRKQLAEKGGGDDANGQKLSARKAALDALVGQINRVQSLYAQNIRGSDDAWLPGGIDRATVSLGLNWAVPTAENAQFDSAAAGLAEQGLSAFRVPGVGSQSDAELRQFVQANRPSASDYNTSIEEKMRQLRARVDESRRSLGMPPAQWEDKAAAAASPARQDGPTIVAQPGPASHGTPDRPNGPGADEELVFNDESRSATGKRLTSDQEAQFFAAMRAGDEGQALALMHRFTGVKPTADTVIGVRQGIQTLKKGGKVALNYGAVDKAAQQAEDLEKYGTFLDAALEERKNVGIDPLIRGVADTGSFGFADEIAAGAETLFRGGTMKENLQRERAKDEADSRLHPVQRIGGQITGGFLNPIGRGATTPGQMTRAGALGGGAYGAGSGTDLQSRSTNALLGAGGGAAAGYTVAKTMNALAPAAQKVFGPSKSALRRADEMAVANEAAAAARAEGVPVSRGLLDPRVSRKVTALETMPGSGEVIQEGLDATRTGLQAGVARLGRGGTARDSFSMGETLQAGGRDFIKRSREVANRLYDRAEELGGSTPINPQSGLKAIRDNIMELRATPKANHALISYLETIGEDLSGGITVSGLRNLRTQMRGQISERNLTASDAERRVLGILDAASEDIATAFKDNPAAAQAYARADKLFRQKQTYIKDVVQKFIGRRDSPMSAEDAWRKFEGMAKDKDSRRLAEMMRALDPDEARDVAATFAEQLGRNNAGEFTVAQLVSQAEKLSDRAKLTIFGPQGKQSLDNLVTVARATRVPLNSSRTGVASNYRSWVANLVGIVGGGGAGGAVGGTPGAIAGSVIGKMAADKAEGAANAWTARALMSPEITKWLASAPKTTDPAQIDAHIRRLSSIGARNPQLAEAVGQIERRLVEAIGQLPPRVAAGQGQEPRKP